MGTFSQTNIKCADIDTIISEIRKYYRIGRTETSDERKEWLFNLAPDNNITIIISQNFSNEWVEVEFDFDGNLYFYDECLRRISKSLNTEVLLGYYQSTTGEGRLAKFKNGDMELSFYERYFYFDYKDNKTASIDRIYVADNFGVSDSKVDAIRVSKLGIDSTLLNYDFIYNYFESEGWRNDLGKDYLEWTYNHIEQIK
jgi:hypothetical protein